MHTSKAFHATLPWLDDAELSRLRAWACQNCAASSLAREDDVVIWRATSVPPLRSLHAQASCHRRVSAEGSLALPQLLPRPVAPMLVLDAGEPAESDVKVIALGNSSGRARAPSRLQVLKD